jgi:heme/copper-type cytochrome/quinol oxidase subunit 3
LHCSDKVLQRNRPNISFLDSNRGAGFLDSNSENVMAHMRAGSNSQHRGRFAMVLAYMSAGVVFMVVFADYVVCAFGAGIPRVAGSEQDAA